MKTFKCVLVAIFGILVLFLQGCSKPSMRLGMEYVNSNGQSSQGDGTVLASSIVYVFRENGVSVWYIISPQGNVFIRKKDGAYITGSDPSVRNWNGTAVGGHEQGEILSKGDNPDSQVEVDLGPGDRMPILDNAPYKIQGDSVLVDWSQGHNSTYFNLSRCNSGSEVFTIKNSGLVLDSSTQSGFTLTMGNQALSPEQQQMHDETLRNQRKTRQLDRQKHQLLGY